MKAVIIIGAAGNTESAGILIAGDCTGLAESPLTNAQAAEEAARMLYNRLPSYAWKALVAKANELATTDPYQHL